MKEYALNVKLKLNRFLPVWQQGHAKLQEACYIKTWPRHLSILQNSDNTLHMEILGFGLEQRNVDPKVRNTYVTSIKLKSYTLCDICTGMKYFLSLFSVYSLNYFNYLAIYGWHCAPKQI